MTDLDAPCRDCPHTREEHSPGGGCAAIVAVHELDEYCPCSQFEPLDEAFT